MSGLDVESVIAKLGSLYDELPDTVDRAAICQAIIERNVAWLGAYAGHIRILDIRTNELELLAACAQGAKDGPYKDFALRRKRVGQDLSGHVAETGVPRVVDDLLREDHFVRARHSFGLLYDGAAAWREYFTTVRSELIVPLSIDDVTYGVAIARGVSPDAFEPGAAEQFAPALNRASRLSQKGWTPGSQIVRAVVSFGLKLRGAAQAQLERALDVLGGYTGDVWLVDADADTLVHVAGSRSYDRTAHFPARLPIATDHFLQVMRHRLPVSVPDLRMDPAFMELRATSPPDGGRRDGEFERFLETARSEVFIPLMARDTLIGCATMTSTEVGHFSHDTNVTDFGYLMTPWTHQIGEFASQLDLSVVDLIAFSVNLTDSHLRALESGLAALGPRVPFGHVRLLDEPSNALIMVAGVGPYQDFVPAARPLDTARTLRAVVESGRPVTVTDLRNDPRFAEARAHFDVYMNRCAAYRDYLSAVRSEYVVRLEAEGRSIGTATLQHTDVAAFTPALQSLFRVSMRSAAQVIDRAEFRARLDKVQASILDMASLEELERVLRELAEAALGILSADVVAILQYDSDTGFEQPVIAGVLIRPELAVGEIGDEQWPALMVSKTVEFFEPSIADMASRLDEPWLRAMAAREGFVNRERIKSAAGLLLRAHGEVVGVMFVDYRQTQHFAPSHRQLVRILASQAATAIRNARLLRTADERGRKLALLHDVQTRLVTELRLEDDLQRILDEAIRMFRADGGHIRLLDSRQRLVKKTGKGAYYELAAKAIGPGEGISGLLMTDHESIIVPDTANTSYRAPEYLARIRRENPRLADVLEHERSFACLRLSDESGLVGTLALSSNRAGSFTASDKESLDEYCKIAMIAIRNANMYDNATKNIGKLEVLATAGVMVQEEMSLTGKMALVLTAVTMQGGLEFNRALLFVLDRSTSQLVPTAGIGPFTNEVAENIYDDPVWQTLRQEQNVLRTIRERANLGANLHTFQACLGPPEAASVRRQALGQYVARAVRRAPQITRGTLAQLDSDDVLRGFAPREFVLAPLVAGGDVLGVLYVDNQFSRAPIDAFDESLLKVAAAQLAVILQTSRAAEAHEAELNHQAARHREMLEQQLVNLSHVTLQPLDGIQHLSRELVSQDDLIGRNDAHKIIDSHIVDLRHSLQTILAYSKSERQVLQLDLKPVNLCDLVSDIVKLCRAATKVSELTHEIRGPRPLIKEDLPELPAVASVDSGLMRDVLLSLLRNALKAVAAAAVPVERRNVKVSVCPSPASIVIDVEDTGVGIPPERQRDLFKFGLSHTGGAGVGLAFAQKVVTEHGGTLALERTAVDVGSCFRIVLQTQPGIRQGAAS